MKRARLQRSVSGIPLRSTHVGTSGSGMYIAASSSPSLNRSANHNAVPQNDPQLTNVRSCRHSAPAGTLTQKRSTCVELGDEAQVTSEHPSSTLQGAEVNNLPASGEILIAATVDSDEDQVLNLSYQHTRTRPSSATNSAKSNVPDTAHPSKCTTSPAVPDMAEDHDDSAEGALPSEYPPSASANLLGADNTHIPAGRDTSPMPQSSPHGSLDNISGDEDLRREIRDDDLFRCIDPRDMPSDDDSDYGPSDEEHEARNVPSTVLTRLRRLVTWDRMLANVSFSGRRAMSAEQYQFFSASLTGANPCVKLITYKTIRTTHWKAMLRHCLPPSNVYFLSRLPRHKPTAPPVKTLNGGVQDPADCARIILPSEWAKLDILTLPFYEEVYGGDQKSRPGSLNIEFTPIVQHRTVLTGHKLTIWAEYNDAVCPCERGDVVRFPCNARPAGASGTAISELWVSAGAQPQTESTSYEMIQGVVGHMWTVEATYCAPHESSLRKELTHLNQHEMSILTVLHYRKPLPIRSQDNFGHHAPPKPGKKRKQATLEEIRIPDELRLYPGDTCAFIRPAGHEGTNHTCVFVASLAGRSIGGRSERISWVGIDKVQNEEYVRVYADTTVRGVPTWVKGRRSIPTFPDRPVRNKGKLENGKPYLVYRFALYGDGFQQHKSLSDNREVGGCYMIPLGLPPEARRSSCATRIISLSPAGHSINEVFHLIHDNLVTGARTGFSGIDPFGRPVQIFLDVVSMFGDYPALTSVTDVRGHNATAFCTFCTFRETPKNAAGSRLYSTAMHGRRLGGMRNDVRRNIIRPILNDESAQHLIGYRKLTAENADRLPMVYLARSLRSGSGRTVDENGSLVVPAGFDSVQSIAAAPDHLITGLIEDAMNVCFEALPNEREQRRTELRIVQESLANGLSTQGKFLRWANGKCQGMRSMSMSSRLFVLISSVSPFDEWFKRTKKRVFVLPRKLQRFVSSVYFYPNVVCDGPEALDAYTPSNVLSRQGEQHRAARDYIQTASSIHRENRPAGKMLDKPNVHRALELCVHTITSFGHARNCSEMILEMTHRRFKNWLEVNPHASSHMTGVERAIASDWQSRVSTLHRIWSSGRGTERRCATLGLRRLLLGSDALQIDASTRPGADFLDMFEVALKEAFRDPIIPEMELCGQINNPTDREYQWEAFGKLNACQEDVTMKSSSQLLHDWYNIQHPDEDVSLTWYTTATFLPTSRHGGRRRSYSHHMVQRGCAVSAVTKACDLQRPILLDYDREDDAELRYYAVHGVLLSSTGDVWTSVQELLGTNGRFSVNHSRPAVLRMNRRVRRVALYHVCDTTCRADLQAMVFTHSKSVLHGGWYTVVTRRGGYPPHLG